MRRTRGCVPVFWNTFIHKIKSLLVDAGCCVRITASCGKDVGYVGEAELEVPVDRPGTTIGTQFAVLHSIFLPFLMTYTVASFVSTSPLAVTTVVGLSETSQFSIRQS